MHGYLLMGGQKLGKTMIAAGLAGDDGAAPLKITDVSPLGSGRRLRGRPAALPPPARGAARRGRRLLLRGHRGALQRRPGQQPGQPGVAGDHRGPLEVRRGRARPATRTARSAAWRPGCSTRRPAAWARWAPHEALEETWRLIGSANAELEAAEPWKMEPGPGGRRRPGRRARGPADRGRAHRPGHAVDRGGGVAPDRGRRRPGRRPACPTTPSGAATPAGPTS